MGGGNYYPITKITPLIGSKDDSNTRTSIEMESTYQSESATEATKTFETGGYSKMNFYILYTMGAAETSNSVEFKIEGSSDRTNFYQFVNDTTSGATSTLTQREFTVVGNNGSTIAIAVPLDVQDKYCRISFKETGVASNKGSVFAEVTLSGR